MKQRSEKWAASARRRSRSRSGSTIHTVLGELNNGRELTKKIEAKWRWHYCALLSLREYLLKERGERLSEISQALEPHSMDMADSATDEFDHDLAFSGLSAGQDSLYEVEAAIKRILAGTYGVCVETGQPIPEARLKAVPWTRFTREVEERLETKGAVGRTRLGQVGSVRGAVTGNLAGSESVEDAEESVANDEVLGQVFRPSFKPEPAPRRETNASARFAQGEVVGTISTTIERRM